MDTYQYREIHANELEIPKYYIRFLFIHLIVRKIGISCEIQVEYCLYVLYMLIVQSAFHFIHTLEYNHISMFSPIY